MLLLFYMSFTVILKRYNVLPWQKINKNGNELCGYLMNISTLPMSSKLITKFLYNLAWLPLLLNTEHLGN